VGFGLGLVNYGLGLGLGLGLGDSLALTPSLMILYVVRLTVKISTEQYLNQPAKLYSLVQFVIEKIPEREFCVIIRYCIVVIHLECTFSMIHLVKYLANNCGFFSYIFSI